MSTEDYLQLTLRDLSIDDVGSRKQRELASKHSDRNERTKEKTTPGSNKTWRAIPACWDSGVDDVGLEICFGSRKLVSKHSR